MVGRRHLEHPLAGLAEMPRTEALFRTIWQVDQDWMPEIRRLVVLLKQRGERFIRLGSNADLDGFDGGL